MLLYSLLYLTGYDLPLEQIKQFRQWGSITPGHPERGEEAFTVCQHGDGTVAFTVTAFSAPASPLARAAGPLGRAIQHHLTSRYLRALAGPQPR